MIEILTAVGYWISIGIILFTIKVFVYCRGPKHYFDMNEFILEVTKNSLLHRMKSVRARVGDMSILNVSYIISAFTGPFVAYEFIRFSLMLNRCQKIALSQQKK